MRPGPSLHLAWDELACHDAIRTPYPLDWRGDRALVLAEEFEALRVLVRVPLLVLSAYRTPEWNARVEGALDSQHLHGRALDLVPVKGATIEQLWRAAIARAAIGRIRGIGWYASFVHIDIRPGEHLALWGPQWEAAGRPRS